MSELIDRQALKNALIPLWNCRSDSEFANKDVWREIENAPTIDAVPVKFVREVIEYLTKCRDNAIHEETKTAWEEQRQTLIMLLHEWDAWKECGRTGKYGERKERSET